MSLDHRAKYQSRSAIVRRLVKRFLITLGDELQELDGRRVVDLGCGEGFVAEALSRRFPELEYRGLDASEASIAEARRKLPQLKFEKANFIHSSPAPGWPDTVLMLEVLEHLENPEEALEVVSAWAPKTAIFSVPWEPFFRLGNLARGRDLSRLGNHPEHVGRFTPKTFRLLLQSRFPQVRVRTCFPWIFGIVSAGEGRRLQPEKRKNHDQVFDSRKSPPETVL